jgi:hypothetical protein
MHFTIQANSHQDILRAELSRRETAEEMHEFSKALNAEIRKSGLNRTLIWVRHSRPLFSAEQYAGLTRLAADPAIRIALVAEAAELRASHHYVELLTRQQGANVRGFNDEESALEWLRNGDPRARLDSRPDVLKL